MYVRADGGKRDAMRGFTLIELVVGITLMAIVGTLLINFIVPVSRQSAEPLVQQRAASLAQALMDEILSKRYDETTPEGGVPRCTICTAATSLGAEPDETRATFDDVDDYNALCGDNVVTDANDVEIESYRSFYMRVCVIYDSNYGAGGITTQDAKRITVTILPRPPSSIQPITFTAYRANF